MLRGKGGKKSQNQGVKFDPPEKQRLEDTAAEIPENSLASNTLNVKLGDEATFRLARSPVPRTSSQRILTLTPEQSRRQLTRSTSQRLSSSDGIRRQVRLPIPEALREDPYRTPGAYRKLDQNVEVDHTLDKWRKNHSIIVTESGNKYLLMHTFDKTEWQEFIGKYPEYNNPKFYEEKGDKIKLVGGKGNYGKFRFARKIVERTEAGKKIYELGDFVGVKKTRDIPAKIEIAKKEAAFIYDVLGQFSDLKDFVVQVYDVEIAKNKPKDQQQNQQENPEQVSGKTLYQFTEIISGGDVYQFARNTEENIEARKNAAYLFLHGLSLLHAHDSYHGDLKGDNVLFKKGHPKFIDFGAARYGSSEVTKGGFNNLYAPYEYFFGTKHEVDRITYEEFDSWAAGLTLLEMYDVKVHETLSELSFVKDAKAQRNLWAIQGYLRNVDIWTENIEIFKEEITALRTNNEALAPEEEKRLQIDQRVQELQQIGKSQYQAQLIALDEIVNNTQEKIDINLQLIDETFAELIADSGLSDIFTQSDISIESIIVALPEIEVLLKQKLDNHKSSYETAISEFIKNKNIPEELRSVISKMLSFDKRNRLNVTEAAQLYELTLDPKQGEENKLISNLTVSVLHESQAEIIKTKTALTIKLLEHIAKHNEKGAFYQSINPSDILVTKDGEILLPNLTTLDGATFHVFQTQNDRELIYLSPEVFLELSFPDEKVPHEFSEKMSSWSTGIALLKLYDVDLSEFYNLIEFVKTIQGQSYEQLVGLRANIQALKNEINRDKEKTTDEADSIEGEIEKHETHARLLDLEEQLKELQHEEKNLLEGIMGTMRGFLDNYREVLDKAFTGLPNEIVPALQALLALNQEDRARIPDVLQELEKTLDQNPNELLQKAQNQVLNIDDSKMIVRAGNEPIVMERKDLENNLEEMPVETIDNTSSLSTNLSDVPKTTEERNDLNLDDTTVKESKEEESTDLKDLFTRLMNQADELLSPTRESKKSASEENKGEVKKEQEKAVAKADEVAQEEDDLEEPEPLILRSNKATKSPASTPVNTAIPQQPVDTTIPTPVNTTVSEQPVKTESEKRADLRQLFSSAENNRTESQSNVNESPVVSKESKPKPKPEPTISSSTPSYLSTGEYLQQILASLAISQKYLGEIIHNQEALYKRQHPEAYQNYKMQASYYNAASSTLFHHHGAQKGYSPSPMAADTFVSKKQ